MTDRTVLIFRKDLLPISETFIRAQAVSFTRWRAKLSGFRQVGGLDLDQLHPEFLFDCANLAGRLFLRRDQFLPAVGLPGLRPAQLLDRSRPDLLHVHFAYDAVLMDAAARRAGIPMVTTLHGTDILRSDEAWRQGNGLFFRFYPRMLRRLFRNSDAYFLAVSEPLRAAAIARGAPAERTYLAHTGIDDQPFRTIARRRDNPTILFIGRLVEFKGCEYLIRAVAEAGEALAGHRLVIAGDGPLRSDLERLAADFGVDANFLGKVSPERVRDLLGNATLLCLPSITDRNGVFEAFGMVMLEAQAAGVPVVTSARAGAEAIRPGRTGLLFPERDVARLAQILAEICGNPAMVQGMSDAARRHVHDHFAIGDCTKRIEDLYDLVVASSARSHSRRFGETTTCGQSRVIRQARGRIGKMNW